jgi:hypothetical protein
MEYPPAAGDARYKSEKCQTKRIIMVNLHICTHIFHPRNVLPIILILRCSVLPNFLQSIRCSDSKIGLALNLSYPNERIMPNEETTNPLPP